MNRRLSWTRCVGWCGLMIFALCATAVVPVNAADHRDGPKMADLNNSPAGALDLNDLYIFVSPTNPANTVFIQTMSPGAGVVGPAAFFAGGIYELRISNDSDPLTDEIVYQTYFSPPNQQGRQSYQILRFTSADFAAGRPATLVANGVTNSHITNVRGGGRATAGIFDDPFFFDASAFARFNREATLASLGRPTNEGNPARHFLRPSVPNNFFGGFNTLAIVIEVPRLHVQSSRQNTNISAWIRSIGDIGDGRGFGQFDRTALPAINTALPIPTRVAPEGIIDPTRFQDNTNLFTPASDIASRPAYAQRIVSVYGNTQANADALVNLLLPDVMHFSTTDRGGFPNGRRLPDDVIDIEFGLLTNNGLPGDRVVNDSFFRSAFPYLGSPNPVTRVLSGR